MTAPKPFLEVVARAICRAAGADPDQPVYLNGHPDRPALYHKWQLYREEAEAALKACRADDFRKALERAHAHVRELRDAWERGAISEHDGRGGTRSNRNVEVKVELRDLIAKLAGKP